MHNIEHATPALFAALATAQGEIENASKNAKNPHFKSSYADLAEVLNTIRPVFSKHGLSLIQSTGYDGSLVHVSSILAHAEGGYLTTTASCQPAKSDAQGIGSATTYLRRYSAAAVAGIAQEDDDGQAAAHNGKPAPVTAISGRPTDGAWEAMDSESQAFLRKVAAEVIGRMADVGDAFDYIEGQQLGSDERAALWTQLDSKTRSALKREHQARQGQKAA